MTGCALADFEAGYLIALRRRDTLRGGGDADLRGEHPIIVEATSPEAAERIRDRATALGIGSTSGTHADGTWIEFLDPDGIAIRVVHSTTLADSFFGVVFGPDGEPEFYDSPRVQLPPPAHVCRLNRTSPLGIRSAEYVESCARWWCHEHRSTPSRRSVRPPRAQGRPQ